MQPDESLADFAARLRRRRQQLDLTRAELAQLVGCSADTIKKLESGARRPSKQLAQLLVQHLRLEDEEIAGFLLDARRRAVPIPGNLPASLTSFVGRDDEITHIAQLLHRQGARLVTLVGAPGVGKSRLAVQSARALAAGFPDGVWYLDGSRHRPPERLIPLLARLFGMPDGASPREWLIATLRPRRLLLVLDGFESFLPDADALTDLLTACDQISALVTSGVPLRVYGEQRMTVPPLALPPAWETTEELAGCPVVQLFVARVSAHHPEFRLTAGNAATVAALCARLDGIPLALELAAGRADAATPHLLLAEIDRQGSLDLSPDQYDEAAHHATLRVAIGRALAPLGAPTRDFFAALGLFRAPFDAHSAQAVAAPNADPAQVHRCLDELVARHLIQRLPEEEGLRYRLLDTLREAAVALLGDAPPLRRRHAAYFARQAQDMDPARILGNLSAWRAHLRQTHADWLTALQFSQAGDEQDRDPMLWLATTLGHFWYVEGDWEAGAQRLADVLLHPDGAPALRSRVRSELGILYSALGRYAEAEESLTLAHEEGRRAGDAYAQMWALAHWVHLLHLQGRHDEVRLLNQERARLTRHLPDDRYRALILDQMGTEAVEQGDYEVGVPWLQDALTLWEAQDAPGSVGSVHCVLGMAALAQGDASQALADFQAAHAEFSRITHAHGLAWVLRNLGLAYLALGRLAEARRALGESLARYHALQSSNGPLILVEACACYITAHGARALAAHLMASASARRAQVGLPLTTNSRQVYARLRLPRIEPARRDLAPTEWERVLAQTHDLLAEVTQD